jgi:hypothetical protein
MSKYASFTGLARRWPAAAVLFATVLLLAAPADAADGRFGFFGGLNIANLGQDAEQLGDDLAFQLEDALGGSWSATKVSKSAFGVGAYYVIQQSPTVGFQLEAQYIRRGVGYDITEASLGTLEGNFKLDRFEIPVLLRLTPGGGKATQAFFLVGPVVSIQTSANFEASAMGQSESTDAAETFKSASFGALGGVGLTIQAGPTSSVVLQARYCLGLTNVLDDPSGTYSARHSDFGFFAGMEFALVD